MNQDLHSFGNQSTNDTLRMLAESTAVEEEEPFDMDDIVATGSGSAFEEENVFFPMTERELITEQLMTKELKNLQFDNPGANQVLAEYQTISNSRKKRAVRQRTEQKTERKDPFHDEKGKLIVNGERFFICDCLRAACQGCHWPCPKCNSRRCGPVCQVNRPFTYASISNPYDNVEQFNPFISD